MPDARVIERVIGRCSSRKVHRSNSLTCSCYWPRGTAPSSQPEGLPIQFVRQLRSDRHTNQLASLVYAFLIVSLINECDGDVCFIVWRRAADRPTSLNQRVQVMNLSPNSVCWTYLSLMLRATAIRLYLRGHKVEK